MAADAPAGVLWSLGRLIEEAVPFAADDSSLLAAVEDARARLRGEVPPPSHAELDQGLSDAHSESYRLGWRAGSARPPAVPEAAVDRHVPVKVGWATDTGDYITCRCSADRFGEGPRMAVADYTRHLLGVLGIELRP